MEVPQGAVAAFWGLIGGSALLLGALVGSFSEIPQRLIAAVMAFGSGVLMSALSFELMDEAYRTGGFQSAATGFLAGAAIYTLANWRLSRRGATHRKRSGHGSEQKQPTESEVPGSGLAIAVGALLDGVPESIALGVSMIGGGRVSSKTGPPCC